MIYLFNFRLLLIFFLLGSQCHFIGIGYSSVYTQILHVHLSHFRRCFDNEIVIWSIFVPIFTGITKYIDYGHLV